MLMRDANTFSIDNINFTFFQNSLRVVGNGNISRVYLTNISYSMRCISCNSYENIDKIDFDADSFIERGSFSGIKSLTSLTFNKVRVIGERSFSNCNLQTVFMSRHVIQIEDYAFSDNSNLALVSYCGQSDPGARHSNQFYGCSFAHKISVPKDDLNFDGYSSSIFCNKFVDNLLGHEICGIETFHFTYSVDFEPSVHFSDSSHFIKTQLFSHSNIFSKSKRFIRSDDFSESNRFIDSLGFSKSNDFMATNSFSTKFFTESNDFIASKQFSSSEKFSKSFLFIATKRFSHTNNFVSSIQFSNSGQFEKTSIFTGSNQFKRTSMPSSSTKLTGSSIFISSSKFTASLLANKTQSLAFSFSNQFTKSKEFTESSRFSSSSQLTGSHEFTSKMPVLIITSEKILENPLIEGKNNNGIAIGVSVGVFILIALVVVLIVFFIIFKKKADESQDYGDELETETYTTDGDDTTEFDPSIFKISNTQDNPIWTTNNQTEDVEHSFNFDYEEESSPINY